MRGDKDEKVFEYLNTFTEIHNRMPTNKELEIDLKLDHGHSFRVLKVLEDQGKIKRITQGIPYKVVK